jgi:GNAT superfamily N-acetyltransferase
MSSWEIQISALRLGRRDKRQEDQVLHKIEQRDAEKLVPLLAELAEMHLNVVALQEGTALGQMFADDVANPRSVYLISGDGHYLGGEAGNPAFNAAVNAALPRDTYFVLFCDAERWAGALDVVLNDTYAVRAARCTYTLRQLNVVDWKVRLPAAYTLRTVEASLLAQDLENRDAVVDGILETWLSVDSFLAHGFGSCLVHDATVVSWSLADYVSGERCEIGIYTDEHYRRQGLGTLTATANAAHAVGLGYSTVGWHCWANNAGSIGVAEKVSFQKTADYDVFINHWAAENVGDMSQDEFRAFAEHYEREFEAKPPAVSGYPHVVAATAWALAGSRASCFRHLHKAVDLGWLRSAEHLRQLWPEFFASPNLDQMQEWHDLARRLDA